MRGRAGAGRGRVEWSWFLGVAIAIVTTSDHLILSPTCTKYPQLLKSSQLEPEMSGLWRQRHQHSQHTQTLTKRDHVEHLRPHCRALSARKLTRPQITRHPRTPPPSNESPPKPKPLIRPHAHDCMRGFVISHKFAVSQKERRD